MRTEPDCQSESPVPLTRPLVYLTVGARASVSWLGRVDARRLVLNWEAPGGETKSGGDPDWVGLFGADPSKAGGGGAVKGLLCCCCCCCCCCC